MSPKPASADAGGVQVELRAARLPYVGRIAWHHWFVVRRPGAEDRWEVWQRADAGGQSWGHLHRNLLPPLQGVGNGESWPLRQWSGEPAERLAQRIEASPQTYPHRSRYAFWPGPNSNSYVQWILGQEHRLTWQGWGRRRGDQASA